MTRVSVVVISKHERSLDETLRAVTAQCRGLDVAAEVVVVDASGGALDRIAAEHPDVRWVPFTPATAKRVTIPEQRNVGVLVADGDVVVFTDCGCVPEPGWLAALVKPILAGEEQIVSGAVRTRGRSSIYDFEDAIGLTAATGYVDECATINLAFTKAAYRAAGGFDESFGYGSDVDMSWRWRDAGYRIRRVDSALVRPDWGSARRQLRRSFQWGAARARLYAKHRRRLGQLPRREPMTVAYPMFILGLPLTAVLPAYPLLLLVPLWRNRGKRPVRVVVDHLAYGTGVLWQVGRELTGGLSGR